MARQSKLAAMSPRTVGYWTSTGLLAVALLGSGIGALVQLESLVEIMGRLGFPIYVARILGAWYVSAAVALVVPGFPRVKEWAYAGVIFAMTGAFASHVFAGDTIADYAPSLVLISLAVASYVLRPPSRRLGALLSSERDGAH